jgi:progressive ankylosis protein
MHSPLSFRPILMFFLPLMLMMELHQIGFSLVQAFLARLADPKATLAGFSIAFAFNTTISSMNQVCVQGGISFITDRFSFWRIFRFYGTLCVIIFVAIQSVAMTAMGDIIFGKWMGASAEAVMQARKASMIMALWVFPILIRNLAYALVMIHRRTILISNATFIRMISLGLFLIIFPFWLGGAAVGAAAMVSSMVVEAVYMVIVTRPLLARFEKDSGKRPSYDEIWRFSWPLMTTQISENGIPLSINFFLGQLSNPDLALAGFGIANGLMRTFLSPLRNLVQTAQALIRSREDLKVMFQFAFKTVLFFVAIVFLMFYSPLRGLILEKIMGLTLELSQYAIPGVKLTFLVAIFWGYSALLRGMLAAMRRTGAIAVAAGLRLLAVVLVCSVTLFLPHLNGTVVGILAVGSAFATDLLFLGLRLRRHFKTSKELFPHLQKE